MWSDEIVTSGSNQAFSMSRSSSLVSTPQTLCPTRPGSSRVDRPKHRFTRPERKSTKSRSHLRLRSRWSGRTPPPGLQPDSPPHPPPSPPADVVQSDTGRAGRVPGRGQRGNAERTARGSGLAAGRVGGYRATPRSAGLANSPPVADRLRIWPGRRAGRASAARRGKRIGQPILRTLRGPELQAGTDQQAAVTPAALARTSDCI